MPSCRYSAAHQCSGSPCCVLPAAVVLLAVCLQASKMRRIVQDSDKRKLQRRIQHSAPGAITVKPERKKKIVAELE